MSRLALLSATVLALPCLADDVDAALDAVAAIHGEAGPWATAGYRMGPHAMKALGATSPWDLQVEHRSPATSQFACVADGVQAATKVSVGKLSLRWSETNATDMQTVFTRKSTGQVLVLRPTQAFVKRFLFSPREKAREAARQVMELPEKDVFEVVTPVKAPEKPPAPRP